MHYSNIVSRCNWQHQCVASKIARTVCVNLLYIRSILIHAAVVVVDTGQPTDRRDSCVDGECAEYADSSFFDDQSHDYPTVEEQIKMARRVAQSLTAPANQATRGHRMYMKRKEKSVNWTVDDTNRRRPSLDAASEDLYYNPAPTKATATWKPKLHDLRAVSLSPLPRLFAPRVPPASEENAKYMSAEEFERMRLFEDKTTHDTVAPQLCFNLAADLRQSASKGGRMFAKRRAKADQWTVENNPLPRSQVGTALVPSSILMSPY